ncbi:hypothetical protein TNCV_2796471 [Trichonephila clavipes]|nr:hypothetical protein TNCV_2796471 [Trichonephila clavipes]
MIFAVGLTSITQWDCDSSVVKLGERVPAQVSSSSLDNGSDLQGSLPKALMQLKSVTLIFTHSITRLATLAALSNVNGLVAPRMDCTQAAGKV